MPSFPRIEDLPPVLSTVGWSWQRFETPTFPSKALWLGADREGRMWLTKLGGGFRGYRELVFARLAQRLGWSCQTSVFAELDDDAVKMVGKSHMARFRAMHWFMTEHPRGECNPDCELKFLIDRPIKSIEDLMGSEILHLIDWPKSEFAACLFGGNEPPGRLFTTAHEFVIIDSELMFASQPSDLSGTMWWNNPDGTPSPNGRQLALEVCREVAGLSEGALEQFLQIPEGVTFEQPWPIRPLLKASYESAKHFVKVHAGASPL